MVSPYRAVSIFVFVSSFFITLSIQSQELALPKDVIATISAHQITVKEFTDRYSVYLLSSGIKDNIVTRRSILNNMINEYLLLNIDDNDKILNDSEYQKEIKWAKKQTVLAFLKDQEVYAKLTATDKEVRDAYYKSNEKIAVRHLYAASEEEANSLYQLLKSGSDFKALARQVFSDSILQNNGGYLGYFSWGEMDPTFEDVAYALKIGEISKPVKTTVGYSIIKLEDRKPNPLLTETEFLKKRKHMENVVRMRKKRFAEIDFINKNFAPKKMWYNEKLLGNILNNLSYSPQRSVEESKLQLSSAVCVKYEKRFYKQDELERRIDEIPIYHREKITTLNNLKAITQGIIAHDILYDLAEKKKYDKDTAVSNTYSKYCNEIFLRYKRKEIADKTEFPDSAVQKFYRENAQYFTSQDEMNIQEIIINRKSLADSLIARLNNGEDFGLLAKKHSIRSWSAINKGEMGFAELTKYGMMKDVLWKSEIGKIVGPINIEGRFGIFKVLGKRSGEIKKFENVKEDAVRLLKKEKSKDIMQNYINKIMTKVPIRIDEELLANSVIKN